MFENMACNRNLPTPQYLASRSDIQEESFTLVIVSVVVFYEVIWQKKFFTHFGFFLLFLFKKTDLSCSS